MTAPISIDFSQIERYARRLGENSDLIQDELERAMTESVILVEGAVVKRTPVNTGSLRQSIDRSVRGRLARIEGRVFTPSPYGLPVERGRKPGKFPPIAPIELWVRRKLQVSDSEARSVAFLVARKIARRGTKGAFMFQEGLEASRGKVNKTFDQAGTRIVDRMARL